MPWSQTTPMHQRTLFIADHLRGTRSVSELCIEYGISRKAAYKWIDRYIRRGPAGLDDHSCRPLSSPYATEPAVIEAIVLLRHQRPTWGAKKLLAYLKRRHPDWRLPGLSVTCSLLRRRGLVRTVGSPEDRPSRQAQLDHRVGEPRVVRGLQGSVPDGQWPVLLSPDRN